MNFYEFFMNFSRNFCEFFMKCFEINIPNNFCLDNKRMDFRPNITPIEVIKKGAFGGTYFRDIYSCINHKLYKNS